MKEALNKFRRVTFEETRFKNFEDFNKNKYQIIGEKISSCCSGNCYGKEWRCAFYDGEKYCIVKQYVSRGY